MNELTFPDEKPLRKDCDPIRKERQKIEKIRGLDPPFPHPEDIARKRTEFVER